LGHNEKKRNTTGCPSIDEIRSILRKGRLGRRAGGRQRSPEKRKGRPIGSGACWRLATLGSVEESEGDSGERGDVHDSVKSLCQKKAWWKEPQGRSGGSMTAESESHQNMTEEKTREALTGQGLTPGPKKIKKPSWDLKIFLSRRIILGGGRGGT